MKNNEKFNYDKTFAKVCFLLHKQNFPFIVFKKKKENKAKGPDKTHGLCSCEAERYCNGVF